MTDRTVNRNAAMEADAKPLHREAMAEADAAHFAWRNRDWIGASKHFQRAYVLEVDAAAVSSGFSREILTKVPRR